ncbi:MAG: hypothetical protein AMXMBFR56_65910 [Polyangiaceae bacterium]
MLDDQTFANAPAVPESLTLDDLREPVLVVHAQTSRELIDGLAEAMRRSGIPAAGVYPEPALRPGSAWIDQTWAEPRLYLCDSDYELLATVVAFDAWMRREEARRAS